MLLAIKSSLTIWNARRARSARSFFSPALMIVASLPYFSPPAIPGALGSQGIDFNHDVRQILSENCFKCHGPDEVARKSSLRLDNRADALKAAESGKTAIAPAAPEKSELVRRITATDASLRMPPPKSGKTLTRDQVRILQDWIAEGAPYAVHWAYRKPTRPAIPPVKDKNWPGNDLDRFILARLEAEHLSPSGRADPYMLIRRVSLDLIGLPPTPEQVESFLRNPTSEAYSNFVDSLLANPAFGEHWARLWLDLARYADSAGYADDPPRKIWAYRDYVVRSFNTNKPFDQFTIEQIAGDLLPDPDEDQVSGSAFHRNTMTNSEGGTDDEEFRNAAIVDRVNTTMAVWMATSIACAQCHSHKYDPISQQEYFRLFAIFNNTEDADRPDESPVIQVYSEAQKTDRERLQHEITKIEEMLAAPAVAPSPGFAMWESRFPLEITRNHECSRMPLVDSTAAIQCLGLPDETISAILAPAALRNEKQQALLVAAERAVNQQRAAALRLEFENIQPTTLPIMRELPEGKRRTTAVQVRGNFRVQGETVTEGVPSVFHPLSPGTRPDRLALAKWLVDDENPLTARVLANRLWEQLFGVGIVRTTEEFGSQGEPPSYPELLDYLATEITANKWDLKHFLKFLTTSSTYQQGSAISPAMRERDPENVLLARGPRFRMPAEVIRDQALFVSGLLSQKMYGAPIRPPQPSLGLSAAFGGALDWKTSEGEDQHRRGVYVEWRRTSPYASMATFDAPNREVCTLRRPRSNTPLQALVTLNDPVYFEAAQALARRIVQTDGPVPQKVQYGFRLCLCRPPKQAELKRLVSFYEETRASYSKDPAQAARAATKPLGSIPEGLDAIELAAWTAVGNVLLNLDEMLMRP
jgi:hypothetical protein